MPLKSKGYNCPKYAYPWVLGWCLTRIFVCNLRYYFSPSIGFLTQVVPTVSAFSMISSSNPPFRRQMLEEGNAGVGWYQPTEVFKIFCFGDSLTAGTSPPEFTEYPYAPHLESKLNSLESCKKFLVRHFGLPGWTSTQLSSHEGQLNETLERIKSSTNSYPNMVIILAGTNDLAYCTDEKQCDDIFQSIKKIHSICHDKGIDTMALSIPPSSWQSQSNNDAAKYAKLINMKIENWASSLRPSTPSTTSKESFEDGRKICVHYHCFPIEEFDMTSGFWSHDGLHFSRNGYVFIGERLAEAVMEAIKSDV